ncbi:MAG: hypothetical protein RBT11_02265 [Desulfobacterales bacterium]|jgi:hypothetical protein|nr:hypothetical protein [Desulfobacterales bacterium]
MSSSGSIAVFIREHKTVFVAVLVGLFLLELEIFALAVTKSGKTSWLQISDRNDRVVYEVEDRYSGAFDQTAFEKTFGPISNYQVRRITREVAFPFRAWFVAAVGLPLGGMLILAFVVRAFVAIFEGGDKHPPKETGAAHPIPTETRIENILNKIGRLNIFTIGFILFLLVIGYWIIPNAIVYAGRLGVETITRFKWLFLGGAGVLIGIFIWVIYLRYLLAKKHVESQVELDKFRLQLEYERDRGAPLQLELQSPIQRNLLLVNDAKDSFPTTAQNDSTSKTDG